MQPRACMRACVRACEKEFGNDASHDDIDRSYRRYVPLCLEFVTRDLSALSRSAGSVLLPSHDWEVYTRLARY